MSVAAKIKKMAAKILEDVLNNFISIDSLLQWLSNQDSVSDVNVFVHQYKCNQVEFVSHFLNFLREQSSMILQSSCSVETPCKSSQLRKLKTSNYSSDKSTNEPKFETSLESTGKKLDFKSFESFPSLTESSSRSKINEKNSSKYTDPYTKDSSSVNKDKDSSKKFKRVELFPGKKDSPSTNQDIGHMSNLINVTENRNPATVSTPKSSRKDSVDISDYFNDIVNLDGSPDWNSGFKLRKDNSKSDNSEKISNFSGISGTFKSTSFNSETVSGRSRDSKSTSRAILGDFFLNDTNSNEAKKEKKNKVRRRINPTRVNSGSSRFGDNSSFEISNSTAENGPFVGDEREALKIECANVLEQLEATTNTDYRNKGCVPTHFLSTPSKKVTPNSTSVTFAEELRTISKIYSFILDENYCQNIMAELCFVISLLVIQDHTSKPSDNEFRNNKQVPKFLGSVHNCVYFAVETLWLQRNVLVLLNLAALKLLSENREVEKFNSGLSDFLAKAYVERQSKESLKRQICDGKVTKLVLGNVSFECETDNKDNFTNELNFHSFRKQRDLFYNILATWEENHLTADWEFSVKLDSKIRTLLSICSDPTNLLHLARLFRGQLVMSCCGDYRAEDESDEEILQLFASVDPNKIIRLRARLRSRPKRQGPCPLPDFMGYQEFFKDFIISTSYTVFHYYLKNSLCDEILKLNDAEFSSDQEDDDSCLDQQTQSRYFEQINVLCLLAKFLGFLEFLPYRSDRQWSDRVLGVHCAVRQNLLPLFDLESCLKTAITRHKLTVTLPWIVNYLSMIDFCSARLRTYQNVWRILITVYRQLRSCRNLMNSFYLRLILGWIFQLPNIPSDLFYNILEDVNKGPSSELCIEFSSGLDTYNFIEENILYSICPYLSEINTILTENSGCSVKHIRPVTQGSSSTSSQVAKQLQMRLEESFLHNQSSSTRRTVEFVTERVSSIAVKYLINDIIPRIKEKALQEIAELRDDSTAVEERVDAISEKCYGDLISKCDIESWHLCSVRSEKALSALLSLDLDSTVSETCRQLVIRQSAEKVKRWIQTHITLAIIKKEFTTIIEKNNKKLAEALDLSLENIKYSFPNEFAKKDHQKSHLPMSYFNIDEYSVSQIFIQIRDIMLNIYEGGNICWNEINCAFLKATDVLCLGCPTLDLSPAVEKALIALTLDFVIIICIRTEIDFRKDNFYQMLEFLKQLKKVSSSGSAMERIICPRNLALLLRESKNKNKSWDNLGSFILFIMEEELLTQDQIESQLVSLLRQNWAKNDGELSARLICRILSDYTDKNGSDKFTLLLEYLIETLRDNDDSRLLME